MSAKLPEIFPERDANFYNSSAFWIARTEWRNQFSNLHHPDTNSFFFLVSLLLTCAFVAFLMMYCDWSFDKPASWLRTVRPMCDGRRFASSPFRRLASRGPSFRGFLAWWAMQFVIYLARCLTLHDSVPRNREGSQYQCSPHDALSCLFFTALWHGQCESIVTLTQQPDDIDLACYHMLASGSHVPAVACGRPGGLDHASLSSSREDLNGGNVENAHLALPQFRWRRDALQPPEIQRVRRDGNTCPHS